MILLEEKEEMAGIEMFWTRLTRRKSAETRRNERNPIQADPGSQKCKGKCTTSMRKKTRTSRFKHQIKNILRVRRVPIFPYFLLNKLRVVI
jgi:hypothetical protein